MTRRFRLALLLAACSPAALAQFQLIQGTGNAPQPVGAIFDFGTLSPGDAVTAAFGLQNVGGSAASLTGLTLAGTGFTLSASALPASIDLQAIFKFSVSFRAGAPGSYSATLQGGGVSALLLATVAPTLTYETLSAGGTQPLSGPQDFGTVTLGSSATLRFGILNQTAQTLTVPVIVVSGGDFGLSGASPSGMVLQPLDSAAFVIVFAPSQAASRSGTLSIGGTSYALLGTGQAPPLPKASLNVNLPGMLSGQQGSVAVTFDSAPFSAASGLVALSFAPAAGIPAGVPADPAIAFASGGQTAAFTVAAGSRSANFGGQAAAAFATGTTAGTLTLILQFDGATSQQTVVVAPAAVGLTTVQATRQTGSVTVQASGFDNTRTAGKLAFTFYDSSGNAIQPGAIAADATGSFTGYFQSSTLGGVFGFTAVFPVTGGPTQVASVEMSIANSTGSTTSGRIGF